MSELNMETPSIVDKVVMAAQALDGLFDQCDEGPFSKPGGEVEWKLDGRRQTFEVSMALLSLHDYLNDLARELEEEAS